MPVLAVCHRSGMTKEECCSNPDSMCQSAVGDRSDVYKAFLHLPHGLPSWMLNDPMAPIGMGFYYEWDSSLSLCNKLYYDVAHFDLAEEKLKCTTGGGKGGGGGKINATWVERLCKEHVLNCAATIQTRHCISREQYQALLIQLEDPGACFHRLED